VAATGTPAQKAEWYNSMLSSGYNDASVKALVDSAVGQQTASDWAYLQQLAQSQTAQPVASSPAPSNMPLVNDASYRDTAKMVASTGTPAQKAEWYNSMIGSGYSDAAVKALVDSAVGQQSSSDWAYLQQLAASR
jgi:predicted Ser/Thr protein kinase